MSWLRDDTFFFFSSRRRHTRFDCDWSSDVCSSDLRIGCSQRRVTSLRRALDRSGGMEMDLKALKDTPPWDWPARTAEKLVNVLRDRSEEHTSELQSQSNLVCRLLLEKKKARPS